MGEGVTPIRYKPEGPGFAPPLWIKEEEKEIY